MNRYIRTFVCIALAAVLAAPAVVFSADFFGYASNNSTVWPSGPRPGPNGKRFFNIEGRVQGGDFASFGVADMTVPTRGRRVSVVNNLTVLMTQQNAAFTNNGRVRFWLTLDVFTDINPPEKGMDPALRFDASLVDGVGKQLGALYDLGTADFIQTMDGDLDVFQFTPTGDAEEVLRFLINELNLFRLVITPDDDDVAATYAGQANNFLPGPIVIVNAELE